MILNNIQTQEKGKLTDQWARRSLRSTIILQKQFSVYTTSAIATSETQTIPLSFGWKNGNLSET